MTDNEIIKALECCVNIEGDCESDCPLYEFCEEISYTMVKAVFDLINRQKAEVEFLKEQRDIYMQDATDFSIEIDKQKAEIERLESEYESVYEQARADILGNMADGGTSCHWCIEQHKAEAIKEFAEKLKIGEYKEEYTDHLCYMVDNLVKEMVGDAE
jgi:FtsZ-binding cell division protein ZapB